jgi:hypothetical protein
MKRLASIVVAVVAVLAAGLVLTGTGAAAAPAPYEEQRFARVAAAMAKDPLYVDANLNDVVNGATRANAKAAMDRAAKALGVPVFVVAIPNDNDSESFGKGGAFLAGLHKHLGRDGLFLLFDSRAALSAAAYGVPRQISGTYDIYPTRTMFPADREQPFADMAQRVSATLDNVVAEEPGPPTVVQDDTGVPPFGQERPPLEAEFWGPFILGIFLGAFIAFILILPFWGVSRLRSSRKPAKDPKNKSAATKTPSSTAGVPSRPTLSWLWKHARKELKALAEELDGDRPGMLRAYDAARILFDDVRGRRPATDDVDAVLDLVGVIVLARYGRAARTEDAPGPPCFTNPLHGFAGQSRREIPDAGRFPVCDACSSISDADLAVRVLRVPYGQPHHKVPGRWRAGGFGARRPDVAADVLESLGVE